jgi:hypothetical protein
MAGELLPNAVLKQIGDKLYEQRKKAAIEVEQLIKRLQVGLVGALTLLRKDKSS